MEKENISPMEKGRSAEEPIQIDDDNTLRNDATEHTRATKNLLDHQFTALTEALNGKIWRAPLVNPLRILEVGCGIGPLVMALGRAFPSAEVIGIDLIPGPELPDKPKNVLIIHDDFHTLYASHTITLSSYDVVISRLLLSDMKHWTKFAAACYTLLKPGGFIELHDTSQRTYHIEKGLIQLEDWEERCEALGKIKGFDFDCGSNLEGYITGAGFKVIHKEVLQAPFGNWMSKIRPEYKKLGDHIEKAYKTTSKRIVRQTLEGLESEELIKDYEKMAVAKRMDVEGVYVPLHLVVGQKPLKGPRPAPN